MNQNRRRLLTAFLCLCLCLTLSGVLPQRASADTVIPKLLATTSYTPVALMDVNFITAATSTPGVYITEYNWSDANTGGLITSKFGTGRVEVSMTFATHDGYEFSPDIAVYLNNSPVYFVLGEDRHYLTLIRNYDPMIWKPSVIKNPGDEYVDEGGYASFVANASYAEGFQWYAVDQTGYVQSIYNIPEVIEITTAGEQSRLNIFGVPAWMDGYQIFCTFVGALGSSSNSTPATLHVRAIEKPPEEADEVLMEFPEETPEPTPEPEHVHVFSDVWHYDDERHWRECECGEKIELGAHTLVWDQKERATRFHPGLELGTCSVCGYETERELPYTGLSQTMRFALIGGGGLIALTIVVLIADSIVHRVRRRRYMEEHRGKH